SRAQARIAAIQKQPLPAGRGCQYVQYALWRDQSILISVAVSGLAGSSSSSSGASSMSKAAPQLGQTSSRFIRVSSSTVVTTPQLGQVTSYSASSSSSSSS